MFLRHPILSLATLAYLGVVGWVTLGPQPFDSGSDSLIWRILGVFSRHSLTSWVTYDGVEFSANIAMFVPVGVFFLLLLGRRRWWLAILIGVALTIAIESAQVFLPTRVPDVRDLLANSVGTTLGVVIGLVLTAQKARQLREHDRRVASTAR